MQGGPTVFTHEKAVYLHSVGRVLKHTRQRWGQTYSNILSKHESLSLRDLLYVCRHLLGVSFITTLKVKFMQGSNDTEHCKINCIMSHA